MAGSVFIPDEGGLRAVLESPDGLVGAHLLRIALRVESKAKTLCPVGTAESTGKKGYRGGRLRSSITHQMAPGSPLVVYVGSNVEYAPYVELGTYKMAARPFLRPALDAVT